LDQAARQLEQLRREAERQGQNTQAMADAQRRLQESANAMRWAASTGTAANASAQQAGQRLQEAQQLLQQQQAGQAGQTARDALTKAEDLERRQREVSAGVQNANRATPGAGRDEQFKQLAQQKDQLR